MKKALTTWSFEEPHGETFHLYQRPVAKAKIFSKKHIIRYRALLRNKLYCICPTGTYQIRHLPLLSITDLSKTRGRAACPAAQVCYRSLCFSDAIQSWKLPTPHFIWTEQIFFSGAEYDDSRNLRGLPSVVFPSLW